MKLRITVEGRAYEVEVEVLDGAQVPVPAATPAPVAAAPIPAPTPAPAPASPQAPPALSGKSAGGAGEVTSPLAGSVLSVGVKPGDSVSAGDTLLVLEAMKMESNVASPQQGTVAEVLVAPGDAVKSGEVLVRFS